ncbi:MAG: SDR family NAD(P)-dependent oxidoreductase, partial [Oscillospiraceae bacterium]|nr:SDR family NAD(P)-dependent oxidoreductase [Oscillospiraceae bacterium]
MNMFDLTGKVALVTGGAHSIGLALGLGLAQAGATVCFNCSSQASLERGMASYAEAGVQAHGYVADVTDEEAVKAMIAKIEEEVGVVDILVNNAGCIKRIPMTEMSVEDFSKVIDVDLIAPFICAKAVLPAMIAKGHGKIINICSMMSELGRETVSAYAAAKG